MPAVRQIVGARPAQDGYRVPVDRSRRRQELSVPESTDRADGGLGARARTRAVRRSSAGQRPRIERTLRPPRLNRDRDHHEDGVAAADIPARPRRGHRAAAARRHGARPVADGEGGRRAPVPRMGFFYVPNGMFLPQLPSGRCRRAGLRVHADSEAARAVPGARDRRERPQQPRRDQRQRGRRRAHARARRMAERRPAEADRGRGHHRRQDHRSVRRRQARRRHAAAVARADDRIELHGGQLRERLQLRLPELHVVAHAVDAAAARARSARGLRAHVRRRRQRLGAARRDAQGPQHPRLGDREHASAGAAPRRWAIAGR